MITRTLLQRLFIGFLGLDISAAHALDLTPHRGWRVGNEGPPTAVLQFNDGKDRIDLQPPAGWQAGGGGHAVTFFTPDPMSWMKLATVAQDDTTTDGAAPAAKENLQAWAAQFAPFGAQRLQCIKTIPSAFTVENHASTEFLFTCTLNGFPLSLSISVIDFSKQERLVMLVAAEPGNFEPMRQLAITSMFSWAEVK